MEGPDGGRRQAGRYGRHERSRYRRPLRWPGGRTEFGQRATSSGPSPVEASARLRESRRTSDPSAMWTGWIQSTRPGISRRNGWKVACHRRCASASSTWRNGSPVGAPSSRMATWNRPPRPPRRWGLEPRLVLVGRLRHVHRHAGPAPGRQQVETGLESDLIMEESGELDPATHRIDAGARHELVGVGPKAEIRDRLVGHLSQDLPRLRVTRTRAGIVAVCPCQLARHENTIPVG